MPSYVGACSCKTPKTTLATFALLSLSNEPSFSGSCNLSEKNYCIEYGFIDLATQTSFCTLAKGSFSQNGKCSSQSLIGKCKVSDASTKFYYSPFISTTAKTDCDNIGGIFRAE